MSWEDHADHQPGYIHIAGEQLVFLGKLGGFSDDVIPALVYGSDDARAFVLRPLKSHMIPHCHRVGRSDALDSEASPDAAGNNLLVGQLYSVPAAG